MAINIFEKLKNAFTGTKTSNAENHLNTLRQSSKPQKKENSTQTVMNKLNPFLDEIGGLKYKGLNYQNLLNSNNVSEGAKQFIEQATGLTRENTSKQSLATTNIPNVQNSDTPQNNDVGFISVKYEGGSPGRVATAKGDHGGTSYGMSMFSTNTGGADSFVKWLKNTNPLWKKPIQR